MVVNGNISTIGKLKIEKLAIALSTLINATDHPGLWRTGSYNSRWEEPYRAFFTEEEFEGANPQLMDPAAEQKYQDDTQNITSQNDPQFTSYLQGITWTEMLCHLCVEVFKALIVLWWSCCLIYSYWHSYFGIQVGKLSAAEDIEKPTKTNRSM